MLLRILYTFFFFFNDTATTEIYTLSLHDALPIWRRPRWRTRRGEPWCGSSGRTWRGGNVLPRFLQRRVSTREHVPDRHGDRHRGGDSLADELHAVRERVPAHRELDAQIGRAHV